MRLCTDFNKGRRLDKLSRIWMSVRCSTFFVVISISFLSTLAFPPMVSCTGRSKSMLIFTSKTRHSLMTLTARESIEIQWVLIFFNIFIPFDCISSASLKNSRCRLGDFAKNAWSDVSMSLIL
ncbi:hypothetical protein M758_1G025800 [Ceratodon purpureus]|nr:hypothetical protein M758_1G025800 [Ceratodon purpureus]